MVTKIITVVCCLLAAPAFAQSFWSPYFSEESPGKFVCLGGIEGARCHGSYCDNVGIYCKTGVVGIRAGSFSPFWISEESPNNKFFCPSGSVAVGMRCKGSNCDNLSLRCDPVNRDHQDCRWSRWISEETGSGRHNWSSWPGRHLVGVNCRGSNCDDKRFYHCGLSDKVGEPTASWEVVCAGGQDCEILLVESLEIGNRSEESWSDTVKSEVASKISVGVKILPISIGANVTTTLTETSQRAASIVRTESSGYKASCATSVDMTAYDIHAVWQWVVKVPVDDIPVQIRTCQIACRPDGSDPAYVPGAPEHVGSCLVARGPGGYNPPSGLILRNTVLEIPVRSIENRSPGLREDTLRRLDSN